MLAFELSNVHAAIACWLRVHEEWVEPKWIIKGASERQVGSVARKSKELKTENSKVTERAANECNGKTEREREREIEEDRVHKERGMYHEEEKKRQSNITFTLLSNDWCLYTSGSYFFCVRTRFPAKQFLLFFPRFPLSFFLFHPIPRFFSNDCRWK